MPVSIVKSARPAVESIESLHPDLVFVLPDGGPVQTKADDLDAHRAGAMRVTSLEPEDLVVRVTDGIGITILTARMTGEFDGAAFSSRMRYTRTWSRPAGSDRWRLVAAHIATLDTLP